MENNCVIIFIKNPVYGKVKTRLAKTVGNDKALEVYLKLLDHTHDVTRYVVHDRSLYYSDFIDDDDMWGNNDYAKYLQEGNDLGERMLHAFKQTIGQGYDKAVLIGSDCPEITGDHIDRAFEELDTNDVVLGPAKDGGYYLIGMKKVMESLFKDKEWSTENVLLDTVSDLQKQSKTMAFLETLTDLDTDEELILLEKLNKFHN